MNQLFINLPVSDAKASVKFYTGLGFVPNPLFTFEDQQCMARGEEICLMLQSKKMFSTGSSKALADPARFTNATFTLPVASNALVDELMQNGLAAGGKEIGPPVTEDFMKMRNIEDPDGHHWSIICIDLPKFKELRGK